jgi:putative SOS response-associated peptidase YedK
MCYSAQLLQSYRDYVRAWGADISLEDFVRLYWQRQTDPKIKIAKAMDAAFDHPQNDDQRTIQRLIGEFNARQASSLEQELFKQRKRLADAERKLQNKPTQAASDSQRIAIRKIEWCLGKLSDLRRSELIAEDSRIFPGWYAPVMIMENGRRAIKPMRYQCRLAGKPAFYDAKFPGTYNARVESLGGFWKSAFGESHGIVVANALFENVSRHKMEGRALAPGEKEENVVLEFRPRPARDMLLACLWSRWSEPGAPALLSFAAITDAPPAEVAAAGHDRFVVPIKAEHIDTWLNPDPANLAAQYAILADRERPHYAHRLAA